MELDRHKLEEERRWRLENYQAQVKRLVSSLVDAIQQEAKQVLTQEIRYDDDLREEYTYVRQAGALQHAILQAVNNSDFGGLTRDAGELHAVEMALHTLSKLKEGLPSEVRELLEDNEREGLQERIDSKLARIAELEAADANDCRAGVHEGGRSVGFHRCSRRGKETITVNAKGELVEPGTKGAVEMKVCGTHANEARKRGHFHAHKPNEWSQRQTLGYRQKERREIVAMQAQLSGELTKGEAQKEIGPATTIDFTEED